MCIRDRTLNCAGSEATLWNKTNNTAVMTRVKIITAPIENQRTRFCHFVFCSILRVLLITGFILPVKHEDPLLEIQKKFLSLAEEAMKVKKLRFYQRFPLLRWRFPPGLAIMDFLTSVSYTHLALSIPKFYFRYFLKCRSAAPVAYPASRFPPVSAWDLPARGG